METFKPKPKPRVKSPLPFGNPKSDPQPKARRTDATTLQLGTVLDAKPIPKPRKKRIVQVQATAHENIESECYELKALKHYESHLIGCLQNADLNSLAHKAAVSKLVPLFLKSTFKSLDPCVPRQLMCRYLILNVYKGIKTGDDFQLWLKLLSEIKGTGGIVSQVRRYYVYLTQTSESRPVSIDCKDEGTASSSSKGGTGDKDRIFNEFHIQDLTEILAGCSSKWKEIAISLRLPSNEIENIIMSQSRPVLCLNKIIELWVKGHYKPPTYKVLKQALCSDLVGRGTEASRLEENLAKCGITFSEDNLFFEASKISEDFKICSESQDITVTEGTVVLLEVQVSGSYSSNTEYKWFKGVSGSFMPIFHNEHFPGSATDDNLGECDQCILCVNVEDLTLEGSYRCEVKHEDKTLYSKPILLTVETPLDKHVKCLTNSYSVQPEVPEDAWPPVSVKTYINLALIKQESIHKAGGYGQYTIRGDVDDILRDKEDITYVKAIGGLSSGARLLIEGRPGSGKTTLVHKVSQDWARKNIKFSNVRLLFLIHLRGFFSSPNTKLDDLLNCYFSDNPGLEDIKQYAMKHNGLGLCFILDGLDEYLPSNKEAFIFRLIKNKVLPKSVVIVASRPAAASDFRSIATRQVEVLGFLREQISDYIKHYAFSMDSKYPELSKYLDEHPNILRMCYLPIHTCMVCFLFEDLGSDIPHTETEIYAEFAKYTVLRALYRYDNELDICIESIKDLPSTQQDLYFKISQLAFKMCVPSRQVIQQTEVKDFFNLQKDKDCLGLINIDKMAMRCGFQRLYTFLHLTFQEFLAACYISDLEEEKQIELIEKYHSANHMKQVWKFYCGLVQFNSQNISNFESLIQQTQHDSLFKVQCCFESQKPCACNSVVSLSSTYVPPT